VGWGHARGSGSVHKGDGDAAPDITRASASVMSTAMQWELPPAVLLRVFRWCVVVSFISAVSQCALSRVPKYYSSSKKLGAQFTQWATRTE
jgi:hypothetical protein